MRGSVQLHYDLGLLDHGQWLETISPHLIVGHVHDVQWPARDHRTPSAGELDYTELLKHFPANCPLVWELSPTREAAEIKESMKIQERNVSGTELTLIQFAGVNR